jgi:hypothetical protein
MFNGKDELQGVPPRRSGEEIDTLFKNWEECPASGKKRKASTPLKKVCKARSVFETCHTGNSSIRLIALMSCIS